MPKPDAEVIPEGVLENLRSELRRGSLILAVLGSLHEEQYGYTLRKSLAAAGVEMEESGLYPMLRRLEAQGLLTSVRREEDRREKRFYTLSPAGKAALAILTKDWRTLDQSLDRILGPEPGHGSAEPLPQRRRNPSSKA
jgi:DNA-binding PadR family transcriptional regulator